MSDEIAKNSMPEGTEKTMADFADELDASFKKIHTGDIVTGTVVGVSETEVLLDLGTYTEGRISKQDLSNDPSFNLLTEVHNGDEITATVIRTDKRNGQLVLSRKEANNTLAWEKFNALKEDRTVFPVTITEAVKSGVLTKVDGFRAFIPASRLTDSFVENLDEWVGKTVDVTVIDVNEEKKSLVLSGREAARAKAAEAKKTKISRCKVGTVMEGKVESIMPYGAFVALSNGLTGLVHVSQISKKRVANPASVLQEGQEVTVKIIALKDGKISLSMKEVEKEEAPDDEVPEYKNSDELTTTLGDLFKGLNL